MTEEWRREKVDYVVYNAISYAFERALKETLGGGAAIMQTTMVPLVGVDLIKATEKELGIEFKPGKPMSEFMKDLAKLLVGLEVADGIQCMPDEGDVGGTGSGDGGDTGKVRCHVKNCINTLALKYLREKGIESCVLCPPGFYAASAARKVFGDRFQIRITNTTAELGSCVVTFELIE
ncbi:MAG: hypothetical protein EF813_10145 [Methanosarcinales archaeon]|nr:MAG: hypothetical protein EF813_10145 [Methanosarcinales archaeon]